jgi:glycoside/pentoside/hexuronide:cation symporter, GPH family
MRKSRIQKFQFGCKIRRADKNSESITTRKKTMADNPVEKSQRIPFFEKIGYSAGDSAANFVFMTMVLFQANVYTDAFGLAAATAGWIVLIARLWDAFFDPLMGVMADRTRTRWGSFRPWILYTALPWGVVMYLAYAAPQGWGGSALIAYALITNILLMTIYSANNMPYAALGGVMTGDVQERSRLNAFRFVAVNIAQFIVGGFTMVLVAKFAGTRPEGISAVEWRPHVAHGWQTTMGIWAVLCVVLFLITFLTTKERIKPATKQNSSVRQDFADLLKNRPWKVLLLMTFIHFTILTMRGGASYNYYHHYADKAALYEAIKPLGLTAPANAPRKNDVIDMLNYRVYADPDPNKLEHSNVADAANGLINMLGTATTIIAIMFAPMLTRRFGKKAVAVTGFALATVNACLFYLVSPTNVGLMIMFTVIGALCYGPTVPTLWAMFADVVDYSEWKTGRRATGIVFATIGFALKAGLALGTSAFLWIEGWNGLEKGQVTMPPAVIEGFHYCTTYLPGIMFGICTILLACYTINKKMTHEIADALAERRKKAAEAAAVVA